MSARWRLLGVLLLTALATTGCLTIASAIVAQMARQRAAEKERTQVVALAYPDPRAAAMASVFNKGLDNGREGVVILLTHNFPSPAWGGACCFVHPTTGKPVIIMSSRLFHDGVTEEMLTTRHERGPTVPQLLVAHEYGHYVLRHGLGPTLEKEQAANQEAVKLLASAFGYPIQQSADAFVAGFLGIYNGRKAAALAAKPWPPAPPGHDACLEAQAMAQAYARPAPAC